MKHAAALLCLALLFSGQLAIRAQDTTPTAPAEQTTPRTIEEQIEELQNQLDVLKDAINEPKGAIQTTVNDVRKLKRIKFSGYIQARFQDSYQKSATGIVTETNNFDVRRARVKITGTPSNHSTAVIQFDLAGTTSNGKFNMTTKDAYLAYTFADGNAGLRPTLTFGQFLTPFGYQLVQSSSVRETPEKATVINKLLDAVEYDRGLKVSSGTDKRLCWEAGLFNGSGANTADDNKTKNLAGRVRYTVTDGLDMGVSTYLGKSRAAAVGTLPATDINKQLYGIDAQYYWHNNTLKAEYVTGKELFTRASGDTTTPATTATKYGYYVQLAHKFTPSDTGVIMYDIYQDKSPAVQAATGSGKLTAYTLGWVHALDNATRVKLFYQINTEENTSKKHNVATLELITLF